MKKSITITIILIGLLGYSQASDIRYVEMNLPESVVNNFTKPRLAKEIFSKSLNWIKENYKSPSDVIKTTIENEMIRFEGVKVNGTSTKVLGSPMYYDITYTISLHFKDDKYKFEINDVNYAIVNPGSNTNLKNIKHFYKKSGQLSRVFDKTPTDIENILNELNTSIYLYVENENLTKKDW